MSAAPADTYAEEREVQEKQAARLAEILNGSKDTVEISDEARALSTAPRDVAQAAQSQSQSTATTKTSAAATAAAPESAEDFNAILTDLRDQFGEEEAMRRFDKIMQDAGYERVTADAGNIDGIRASGGLSPADRARTPSMWLGDGDHPNIWGKELSTSNLRTQSTIRADIVDGEVKYVAGTRANYGAYVNQDVYDALNGLRDKNLESAQKGVSFDLGAYMQEHFGSSPQTSVVSASTELGTIAANLLKEAGVDPGAEGEVSFSLKGDGSGLNITGSFEGGVEVQAAIDAALQRNPDMLQAFKDEYGRVALSDASALGGVYDDGMRSVSYVDAQRSFTYSAKEPSAVVMTDYVGVRVSGYTYQKKVSDSFDVNADSTVVVGGGYSLADPDYDHRRVNQELEDRVSRALETGELIDSTTTQAEYDAVRKARDDAYDGSGLFNLGGPKAKLYYADGTPVTDLSKGMEAERADREAEAEQALRDLEADPRSRGVEISYVDEKREVRRESVAKILERFTARRGRVGAEMINSVMEALARLRE